MIVLLIVFIFRKMFICFSKSSHCLINSKRGKRHKDITQYLKCSIKNLIAREREKQNI